MIIVITTQETDPKTGRVETVVSHGINAETDDIVVMQQIPVTAMKGILFDHEIGEYVLN